MRASAVLLLLCLVAVGPSQAVADGPQPLTLAAAVEIALHNNPALAAAEGRESTARAALGSADAERRPQLQLQSRVAHVSEVSVIQLPGYGSMALADEDTWVTTATLQQLIYSGGRATALVSKAGHGADAAKAARLRTRQTVVFAAERAFLLLLATQEEVAVAAKNLAAAESHLRVASDRLAARVVARFDVLRTEVEVQEARQEVIRAEGARQGVHALLLQALGLPDGEYRALPPAPARPEDRPLAALLAAARTLRPDLLGLRSQIAAAEAGVQAARAERLPSVSVAADYLYADPESRTLFSRWGVGASLSLPVLDGGRAAAHRADAQAAVVQAVAAYDGQVRAVEAEVRQALTRTASADAQRLVAEKRVEQAGELLRLAEARFSGGVGTATELADAQASLARARYSLTRAIAEQGITTAELALAVGATATEPVATPPAAPDSGAAEQGGGQR